MNVGDLVALKSGGPLMTIKEMRDGGREAGCIYWNKEKSTYDFYIFPISTLNPHQG